MKIDIDSVVCRWKEFTSQHRIKLLMKNLLNIVGQ